MSTAPMDRSPANPRPCASPRGQRRRGTATFVRFLGSRRWECHLPARLGCGSLGIYATRADAKRALYLGLMEQGLGPGLSGGPECTLRDLLTAYINFGLPGISDKTRTAYLGHLRYRISGRPIGHQAAVSVRPRHVQRWLDDLKAVGVSEASREATRALVERAYDWGYRWGYLALNPAAGVHPIEAEQA